MTEPAEANAEPRTDILLVEDNRNTLVALAAALDDFGPVNLVLADSGTTGLRYLLEQDFALVLLDICLPDMDGFEVASLIRAREKTRHVPIIFLTAHSQTSEALERGYSLGAVDFLFKPVMPDIFRAKVHAFVELHRKREEVKRQAAREAAQRTETALLRAQIARERRDAERLKLLGDTANRLFLEPHPRTLVGELCARMAAHLGAELYLAYTVEPGPERMLCVAACSGMEHEQAVALAGHPDLTSLQPDEVPGGPVAAQAVYSLAAQGRATGGLFFGSRQRHAFAADDLAVMKALAEQMSMAIERQCLIDELRQRAADLTAADRRKDEFLAMLGHELRNPLAPIVNALQIMQHAGGGNPMVTKALSVMERQVHHLVRLVDDLLDVSRISNGKINLREQVIDLRAVVEQAVQTSLPLIRERQHELHIEVSGVPLMVKGDAVRLSQIVSNLLNNAAKYTSPGGNVWLQAHAEGGEAVVRVRDDGIGLHPGMLGRIFEPFVQASRPEGSPGSGLGIGLTLVRQLVAMHRGQVSATSAGLDRGSEFTVRLPRLKTPLAGSEHDPLAPSPVLHPDRTLRVLVVDDSPDIRETLCALLAICGHEVAAAEDGPSGLELMLSSQPQVALIDIGLPGMDGYGLARRVRAVLGNGAIRLIALTGYGRPEDRQRALDAGFDAHLVKPVDLDSLTRILVDGGLDGHH